MTSIVIQDLQKTDLMTELEYGEFCAVNGGAIPLVAAAGYGLAIAGSGMAGVAAGYFTTRYLDNR